MKLLSRVTRGFSAAVLAVSSLLPLAVSGVAHAATQTCTWTGTAGDYKFSTAANWSGCNSSTPLAGDIINFPYTAIPDTPVPYALTNDLGVALGGVTTDNSANTVNTGKTILISTLSLVDGATIETKRSSTGVAFGLVVGATDSLQTISSSGSVNIIGHVAAKFQIAGTLSYVNTDTLNNLRLELQSTDSVGKLKIGANSGVAVSAEEGKPSVTIGYPVEYAATTSQLAVLPSCGAYCGFMDMPEATPTTVTMTGAITLPGDAQIEVGDSVTLNITGAISGGKLTKSATSTGVLNIGGQTVAQAIKTTTCSDAQATVKVDVAQNETYIAGEGCERDTVTVFSGGAVKGDGGKLNWLTVHAGAVVAPGMSPGCLTMENLAMGGEYQFEIGGDEPCTGYDQLKVLNTNKNTTAVTIDETSATIKVTRLDGFTPTQGQEFVILDQGETSAVKGTFMGLVEGATFTQDGVTFKISYKGGDGNDVTLTVMNQPTAPDTGFALVTAHPVISLAMLGGVIAVLFGLNRKLQPEPTKRTRR